MGERGRWLGLGLGSWVTLTLTLTLLLLRRTVRDPSAISFPTGEWGVRPTPIHWVVFPSSPSGVGVIASFYQTYCTRARTREGRNFSTRSIDMGRNSQRQSTGTDWPPSDCQLRDATTRSQVPRHLMITIASHRCRRFDCRGRLVQPAALEASGPLYPVS